MASIKIIPKDCAGKACFLDGHYEDIRAYVMYKPEQIVFFTDYGKYMFLASVEYPETLYCDNNPVMMGHMKYVFKKARFHVNYYYDDMTVDSCEEWVSVDIDHIMIFDLPEEKTNDQTSNSNAERV